jgi:hypothetical protein
MPAVFSALTFVTALGIPAPAAFAGGICGTLADELTAERAGLELEWMVSVPIDHTQGGIEHVVIDDDLVIVQAGDGGVHAIHTGPVTPDGRCNPRQAAGDIEKEREADHAMNAVRIIAGQRGSPVVQNRLPGVELDHIADQLGEGIDQEQHPDVTDPERAGSQRQIGKAYDRIGGTAADQHAGIGQHPPKDGSRGGRGAHARPLSSRRTIASAARSEDGRA